jgi:hypothetical protein
MRKAIIRTFIFFVVIFVLDFCFGTLFNYLQSNAKGGSTGKINYIANTTRADVIIFGSSRAEHHYIPKIIEDSLHLSCYNCGRNGNGIILMYGRYKLLTQRYNPKIIIYDVNPHYDLTLNDNSSYTVFLKPFYDRVFIDSIIDNIDKNEKYKMCSSLYRYNYRVLEILEDYRTKPDNENKGYVPLQDTMKYEPLPDNREIDFKLDRLKFYYFEKLIKDCKGKTNLIFIASPRYNGKDVKSFDPLIELCKKYNIVFLNYNCDKEFIHNKNYWGDSVHMNDAGASVFTKKIIKEIKRLYKYE